MEIERCSLRYHLVVKKCSSAERNDFWVNVIDEIDGLVVGNPIRAWAMAGKALENKGEEL